MGKSSTSEPHTALTQWQNSLPFKFSLIQLVIAAILICSTAWVILSIQRQQVLDQQAVLNQNYGQLIIAKLQEMTSQVETVVGSISSIAKLYRYDHEQLVKTIPSLLTLDNQQRIISGGGVWPEPGAFNQQKFRDSLFWAHNVNDELVAIDSYNKDTFPSYHTEEWYRPTRYFPAGKIFWSKSYFDPTTHESMITASGAMWMDHQFIGAATVDISLEKLNALLRNAMVDVRGYVIALDHQNQVLAYPHGNNNLQHQANTSHTFVTFNHLVDQQPDFSPIEAALHNADKAFIEEAVAERVFTQEQMQHLTRLSHQDERDMLAAIVNNNALNHFNTPKLLTSVTLAHDPILKTASLVSVFLMPNTYWKVLVVTPISPLQDTAKHLVEKVGIYLVCIQLLGLILLFLLQHRLFITPIIEIVQALKRNDSASIELKAKDSHDEIGLLAKTFLSRTQQLEVAMASLDASNLALEQQLQSQNLFQLELKRHKEQLRALLKFSQNLIYVKDLHGKYILVNDKYCEILGIERRRIIGASDFEVFPSQFAHEYQQNDRRVLHNNEAINFEEAIPSPLGNLIYIVTKFKIKDDDDTVIAVGAIAFDITLKKIKEQEQDKLLLGQVETLNHLQEQVRLINQHNNELYQEQEALTKMLEKHHQLNLSREQSQQLMQNFLAEMMTQIMHEQDQLLAKVCQLQQTDEANYRTQITEIMVTQAEKLRHIAQLLTNHQNDIRPLHLAQFMRHLLGLLKVQLAKANVEIVLDCEENIIIDGPAWQYLQLFYRLITNTLNHAFKTHNEQREITIAIDKSNDVLQISIIDNGIGMTEAQLTQLRQELEQELCLGTLTCINLWLKNDLNGSLTISSQLNQGTHIQCHWPLSTSLASQ
ncbi:PAS domain-containing protein [Shewanella baltica]|uniref:PAS domain-containing protein n=1 Tax=Shewanella baltica TaxID=62322 RepID=UPI00217E6195|nr:PAS domain-containing protein [Shewanella baltica]MCS6232487.1 PAS domain-containing protein [Shewanella baltica]